MPHDDFDEWEREDHGEEAARPWRPPSRAGMASLALAVVAGLGLGVASSLASRGGAAGIIGLAVVGVLALMGLVLGIGGLLQKNHRRGFALLGTILSAMLLAIALVLASAAEKKAAAEPGKAQTERSNTR